MPHVNYDPLKPIGVPSGWEMIAAQAYGIMMPKGVVGRINRVLFSPIFHFWRMPLTMFDYEKMDYTLHRNQD